MNPDHDGSVYNTDYPVWKPAPAAAPKHKLSPRAKAGIGVGSVALAAAGMFAWSQYETAQANDQVKQAQIALQQAQVNLVMLQQEAAAAKSAGQETPAQAARREAMEKCVADAASNYNGVADCASAYPVIDPTGTLNDTQSTAASSPTSGGASSPVGLVVIGAAGAMVGVGWVKKKLARV
jgi:hypothetical protein